MCRLLVNTLSFAKRRTIAHLIPSDTGKNYWVCTTNQRTRRKETQLIVSHGFVPKRILILISTYLRDYCICDLIADLYSRIPKLNAMDKQTFIVQKGAI